MNLFPTVYVPVKSINKIQFEEGTLLKHYLRSCAAITDDVYTVLDTFNIIEGKPVAQGVLSPKENVYILTEDEVKKIASDAWDAMVNYAINSVGTVPDKEAYLNNLKLD